MRQRNRGRITRSVEALNREIDQLLAARAARAEVQLDIAYPDELPVSEARDEIIRALEENQVLIVCGETGSGKTTQLPKICAEIGRGIDGMIGHTQPRRVAARTVAQRVADEMGSELGKAIGYTVRFNDQTDPGTRVRMMTDGILLAETQRDRDLLAYDTLIIDEAHERSLNIDFLLGYLARLRKRRPDLKIIITSATIDPERFSRHFDDAPIITVEGRTYPVDVLWRPPDERLEDDGVLSDSILAAVHELDALAGDESGLPDILVFLPGENEIHETSRRLSRAELAGTDVVSLFARLPTAQQDEVFKPGPNRRIVLATNVAETSLTVPRIRAVIDSGLARVSRYSAKNRVQRLPIEGVSQASAAQRTGRCGRIGPGTCVRLYSEEEFLKRATFTQPEILRTNLASVILQMLSLRLGDPARFPFVEKPSARLLRDGYETLRELGAMEGDRLTDVGRKLAGLPVDPRIGRMILTSLEEGCLGDILVIAAALSVQDPRERPAARKSEADLAHSAFRDSGSDFLGFLRMWRSITAARESSGSSKFRQWCKRHYLSVARIREWEEVHRQLGRIVVHDLIRGKRKGRVPPLSDDPSSGAIHRSILSGLLANIGHRQENGEYRGAGGTSFELFPGSVLKREKPPWVVCAELVETSRLWGRTVGRIRGEWVERVAPHLVRRDCLEPHFVPETGHVAAWERVTYGSLVTVDRRRIPFAPLDPEVAREVFIQEALVEEKYPAEAPFIEHNRQLRLRVQQMENRGRAEHLLADESRQYDFYDARIPPEIHNIMGFEKWRRMAEHRDSSVLQMNEEDLLRESNDGLDLDLYPDRIQTDGVPILLHYRNDPGIDDDGVTARIHLETLGALDRNRFDWLVPGLLPNKIEALIRSLPRRMRTRFMPIQETAKGAAEHLPFADGPLLVRLSQYLEAVSGLEIPIESFRMDMLETHQFMRFELVDEHGEFICHSRDFDSILASHRDLARAAFEDFAGQDEDRVDDDSARLSAIQNRTDWDFGDLPQEIVVERRGRTMRGYPAVDDEDGKSVRIRVTDDLESASRIHESGVLRLLAIQASDAVRHHLEFLHGLDQLQLLYSPLGSGAELRRGLSDLAVRIAIRKSGDPISVRDRPSFLEFDDAVRHDLWPSLEQARDVLQPVLVARQKIAEFLSRPMPGAWSHIQADEQSHLHDLLPPGFPSMLGPDRLQHATRYLEGIERRFNRLRNGGEARDDEHRKELEGWLRLWRTRLDEMSRIGRSSSRLDDFRWLIEEYRISLFAQELGTAIRVSPRRLKDAWDAIPGG